MKISQAIAGKAAPEPASATIVGSYGVDLDAPFHAVFGLGALAAEAGAQGVSPQALFAGTGIAWDRLDDPRARVSHRQKLALFGNVRRLCADPETGLKAGTRQRLSHFGVYGYALASSANFGEALALGFRYLSLAGPMLEKRCRVEGELAIFEGRDVLALGELLPLATEFWFSSILALIEEGLMAPFPSRELRLPYRAPGHWRSYERLFRCPVRFEAGVIEWHYDAKVLAAPAPGADLFASDLYERLCGHLAGSGPGEARLAGRIRRQCLKTPGRFPKAMEMAARFSLSVRSLHRLLAREGKSYGGIVRDLQHALATELLRDTELSIEEIAGRVGYSDSANFCRAFRNWSGRSPARFRRLVPKSTGRPRLVATRGSPA